MILGLEALSRASASGRMTHRPEFYRPASPDDRTRLKALLDETPDIQVYDHLTGQLEELVKTSNPTVRLGADELRAAALAHLGAVPAEEYGVWVYYPWSKRLVHLLDQEEFIRVRTDRNRNKITSEEQALLATKRVGVIGLSVGQSVGLTLASERTFQEIRLADFDSLELSNLNRIRSSVHEMGSPKVINVAREIVELDPFLDVTIFPEGLTKENMDAFFSAGGDLDLLIEECDSVDIKILARQKAKTLRIPVVMDMSDRGCLDVERFDLEPDRPLMHGWIDHLDLEAAGRPMTNEEKIPYMLPIVGTDTLSTRMKASMIELGETISTWPQLASAVALGGAMTADVYRRIMLGQFTASGRWYIDLEGLIGNGPKPGAASLSVAPIEHSTPQALPTDLRLELPAADLPITPEWAHALAEAGALAPSAGNMQPWHFVLQDGHLVVLHDKERSASYWDPDHLMAHIALGASLENLHLKAQELGINLRSIPVADPEHLGIVAVFAAERSAGTADPLSAWLPKRCTNRKIVERVPLPAEVREDLLRSVADVPSCGLRIIDDAATIATLAELCSKSEMVRLLDPVGHYEFFQKEVRWTPEEALTTGDGLDLATMEMTPGQSAALRIASDPAAIRLVDDWRGGKALQRFSRKGIAHASAIAVVTSTAADTPARYAVGRAGQRVWLAANRNGWSVHPISAPLFLTHAAPLLADLAPHLRAVLTNIGQALQQVFPGADRPMFMVRLSPAGEPSARSVRIPLDRVLSIRSNRR